MEIRINCPQDMCPGAANIIGAYAMTCYDTGEHGIAREYPAVHLRTTCDKRHNFNAEPARLGIDPETTQNAIKTANEEVDRREMIAEIQETIRGL